ncbi:hypothetical protein EVAR_92261_1 [Eumeta japonica]|uniref:Uncharacterized protein n=1 Tax=Eumeta variegata TaxID=151549 RepID=A0A4C1TNI9_EUMVA|nr:hypothetical protein EVAR_92261_1 [Eumeta japonica]
MTHMPISFPYRASLPLLVVPIRLKLATDFSNSAPAPLHNNKTHRRPVVTIQRKSKYYRLEDSDLKRFTLVWFSKGFNNHCHHRDDSVRDL